MRAYLKPVLAVIIFLVLQVAVGTILAVFCSATNTKITDHPTLLALSIIVSGIITVAILWAMRMIKGKTFNPFRIDWKRAPLGIAAAASAIFAMDLLSEQINLPDLMELEFKELATNPWGILAIAWGTSFWIYILLVFIMSDRPDYVPDDEEEQQVKRETPRNIEQHEYIDAEPVGFRLNNGEKEEMYR